MQLVKTQLLRWRKRNASVQQTEQPLMLFASSKHGLLHAPHWPSSKQRKRMQIAAIECRVQGNVYRNGSDISLAQPRTHFAKQLLHLSGHTRVVDRCIHGIRLTHARAGNANPAVWQQHDLDFGISHEQPPALLV